MWKRNDRLNITMPPDDREFLEYVKDKMRISLSREVPKMFKERYPELYQKFLKLAKRRTP